MAFKFVVLAAFVACASGGFLPAAPVAAPLAYAAAPLAKTVITKVTDAEYDPNPQYSYSYDVADSLTGDFKNQHETRNGDVVQGSYSLLESDGTRRTVDYAADPLNGFNAVVRKEPAAVAVKAAIATPVVKTVAAAPIAATPAIAAYAAPAPAFAAPAPAFAAPGLATYAAGPAFAKTIAAPLAPAYAAYPAPAFAKTFAAPLAPAYGAYAAPGFAKAFF